MKEEIKLHLAIQQVKNLISLLEGNKDEGYLLTHLSSVYYELENQFFNLTNSKF